MDINQETVLDALNDFERKPTDIPPVLDEYLLRIARNGEIIFPWGKLKPLLKRKLEVVCDEFNATTTEEIPQQVPNFDNFHYETLKKTILQAVDAFTSAPFTIQRLCELVTNPKKHYNRTDKYMRGLEKNVLVVSTIEPRIGGQNDSNANVNPVVNGMITDSPREDNECYNSHENNENVSSSNLNTPANHVLLDNFANVFPSAACIPSPSNICMNREIDDSLNRDIDSNFMPNSECVQNQDVEFGPQVSLELTESSEPKDEQMDTSVEEQSESNDACESNDSDACEVTSAEPEITADAESAVDVDEPEVTKIDEQIDNEVTKTISAIEDDVSASEDVKSEADCSESHSEISTPDKEFAESNECQQDDTVSQSDDNPCDASDVSQSDEICEATSAATTEDTVVENISESEEVSQSVSNSDSSEQCLELGSSSSEEPSA